MVNVIKDFGLYLQENTVTNVTILIILTRSFVVCDGSKMNPKESLWGA